MVKAKVSNEEILRMIELNHDYNHHVAMGNINFIFWVTIGLMFHIWLAAMFIVSRL